MVIHYILESLSEDILRILLSALLGGLIGMEREWQSKSAGFRTMMLVCFGAALFTIVSYKMHYYLTGEIEDVTRIASTILTGIGFLGAGLIYRSDSSIHGLTTAATVWATTAIGMAVGIGDYWVAFASTALVWIVLVLFRIADDWFEQLGQTRKYQITFDQRYLDIINYEVFFSGKEYKLMELKHHKCREGITAIWTVRASKKMHDKAVVALLHDERIKELSY